ncbi:DUF2207 domain-containing protein [Microbacterium kyungheense]|uniref:Putative membrane protein DUF2207 n=1 Tax=Microbacterium kyungheense TaxID=1263636 RepID=A0A543EU31_9MICO|nr:DUF2207 domain-containing protein [Microbacterium kyungheense]TQM25069.1 putative membrane protein DUF2207 [Microbacterium kyungheense]
MVPLASRASRGRRSGVFGLLIAMLAGLLMAGASVAPAHADVDDFSFESLDVEYQLGRAEDGSSTLTVVETFVALFPDIDQNHGMRRSIPDTYQGAPLNPQLVSITDEDGAPRESETESEDGVFSMTSRADGFVHGRQTYVFTYTLQNVTHYFSDTGVDEFYWDVNGTAWPQSFGRITARVTMTPDVDGARTGAMACYVGSQGSAATCPISDSDGAVEASATDVGPYQTLTIAIGFAQGTFTPFDSSYFGSPWGWLQSIVAVLGLGGSFVAALIARRRFLRDAPGRSVIIAEYTPPRSLDALQSAVLLGYTTKAIPAEVLEQAIVGSIRIEEGSRKMWGGTRLKAVLQDPSLADADGQMLLPGLFPSGVPGEEFEFGGTDTRFSKTAQAVLKAAADDLKARGFRRVVPTGAKVWPLAIAWLSAALVIVLGVAALVSFVDPAVPLVLLFGGIALAITITILVARDPLTSAGAEARDHLLGLKQFIEWAEADRIRMLQSPQGAERVPVDLTDPTVKLKLYETLLPYAVVFGQEKKWAEELAVLYGDRGNPGWYVGTSGFNAAAFSSGISHLSASASSSSSSGGSSGGGSAGGGGGGGGGGGV